MLICDNLEIRAGSLIGNLIAGNPMGSNHIVSNPMSGNLVLQFAKLNTTILASVALALLPGCKAVDVDNAPSSLIVIDEDRQKVGNLPFAITEQELRNSKYGVMWSSENLEGDAYVSAIVSLANEAKVTVYFDNRKAWRIATSSNVIRDKFGLGVGSRLSELKAKWPIGKFNSGYADGKYANFYTGGAVFFEFDLAQIDSACFDGVTVCDPEADIAVKTVRIQQMPDKN